MKKNNSRLGLGENIVCGDKANKFGNIAIDQQNCLHKGLKEIEATFSINHDPYFWNIDKNLIKYVIFNKIFQVTFPEVKKLTQTMLDIFQSHFLIPNYLMVKNFIDLG